VQINLNDPIALIGLITMLSLAPFVAIMVTSYVKIVVVLSLLRNALGIQQIPPNLVTNGMAIILTIYVMSPVGQDTFEKLKGVEKLPPSLRAAAGLVEGASAPLRGFLKKHSSPRERLFFQKSARKLWSEEQAAALADDSLMVLVPAFTVSELTEAFKIGFLIFMPFIVIDLIISNILMAMGMMMVSPTTISLPFKLLLFVLIDGWTRLIHGLVLTYV
jgi:type III secretion protein R